MSYTPGFRLDPQKKNIPNLKNCLEGIANKCVGLLPEPCIKVRKAIKDMDSVWEVYNGL